MAKRNPRDYTGAIAEKLAKEKMEDLRTRAGKITTASGSVEGSVEGSGSTVTDLVTEDVMEQEDGVEVQVPTTTIRVNTTLEDITVGYGNNYTFEEGRSYRVPTTVANHLEEKGYVWH